MSEQPATPEPADLDPDRGHRELRDLRRARLRRDRPQGEAGPHGGADGARRRDRLLRDRDQGLRRDRPDHLADVRGPRADLAAGQEEVPRALPVAGQGGAAGRARARAVRPRRVAARRDGAPEEVAGGALAPRLPGPAPHRRPRGPGAAARAHRGRGLGQRPRPLPGDASRLSPRPLAGLGRPRRERRADRLDRARARRRPARLRADLVRRAPRRPHGLELGSGADDRRGRRPDRADPARLGRDDASEPHAPARRRAVQGARGAVSRADRPRDRPRPRHRSADGDGAARRPWAGWAETCPSSSASSSPSRA